MSCQMYRSTTLGETLLQTLNEFVGQSNICCEIKIKNSEENQIPKEVVPRIMAVFDKCINHALNNRTRNKTNFKVCCSIVIEF